MNNYTVKSKCYFCKGKMKVIRIIGKENYLVQCGGCGIITSTPYCEIKEIKDMKVSKKVKTLLKNQKRK